MKCSTDVVHLIVKAGQFLRRQLAKPVPSPVLLGQLTERFRQAVNQFAQEHEPMT